MRLQAWAPSSRRVPRRSRSCYSASMPLLAGATHLPTLTTERLALRWLDDADVPALFDIFTNREVTRYWSSPAYTDPAQARRLLEEIREGFRTRTLLEWGITYEGEVVGTCTLSSVTETHRRAEIGYALNRAVWGRGFVAEALPEVFDFAF